MVIPTIFVILLSTQEIERFKPNESTIFYQEAYGYGEKAIEGSLKETYRIDGIIDSFSFESIFIKSDDRNYYLFEKNQEIVVGQPLYLVAGKQITSQLNGIIYDVVSRADGIELIIKTPKDLRLKAYIKGNMPLVIGQTYKTEKGLNLTPISKSEVYNSQGKEYIFAISGDTFFLNQNISLEVFTGKELNNLILVPEECIYTNSSNQLVVRLISAQGKVLKEQEVEISITGQGLSAISGLSVGDLCDFEYGKYMNSLEGY